LLREHGSAVPDLLATAAQRSAKRLPNFLTSRRCARSRAASADLP
jgi:hypothetical protein